VRKRIGESLVRAGLISDQDLRLALAEHERTGERIGAVIVRLNLTAEWQLARTLAHQLGLPYTNLLQSPPDPAAVGLIPKEIAVKRLAIATRRQDEVLSVAMADPLLFGLIKDLETRTGCRIAPIVATRTDVLRAIQHGYPPRSRARFTSPTHAATDCQKCRQSLEPGWQFCPFCAARIATRIARPGPLPGVAAM